MKYLLDTQAWLWMVKGPGRFREQAREVVQNDENRLFLSVASAWEIAIKYGKGKLPLKEPVSVFVPDRMARTGVDGLAVEQVHALRVAGLPHHHRDPFDRILVAQAQVERLPIVTADRVFERYDVEVIRAR